MKRESRLTSFLLAAMLVASLPAGAQLKRGLGAAGSPISTLSIKSPNRVWTDDDGEISSNTAPDMNGDGVLDIRDFYVADRFVSYYLLNGIWDIIADLNRDGEVTIADINYIAQEVNSKFEEQGHLYDQIVVASQAEGMYDVSIVFNVWNPNIAGLQYAVVLPSQFVYSSNWYKGYNDYHSLKSHAGQLTARGSDTSKRFLNMSLYSNAGDYENECYPQGVYEDMYLMFDPGYYGYYDNLGTIQLIDVRAIDNAGNLHLQGDGFSMALSTDVFEVDGVYYRAIGDHVKVLRNPNGYSGTVTIPEVIWNGFKRYTVTSIGDYAFNGCYLRNVIIGDSVTSIGNYAFQNTALRSITIGKSVKHIGSMAFSQTYFSSVICKAVTPPSCPADAFDYYMFYDEQYNPTLYVPAESVEAYKSASPWARFSNIVGGMPKPGDVDGDGQETVSDVTALIDLLLDGGTHSTAGDVDYDGQVTVADVTALIDYLLKGTW